MCLDVRVYVCVSTCVCVCQRVCVSRRVCASTCVYATPSVYKCTGGQARGSDPYTNKNNLGTGRNCNTNTSMENGDSGT